MCGVVGCDEGDVGSGGSRLVLSRALSHEFQPCAHVGLCGRVRDGLLDGVKVESGVVERVERVAETLNDGKIGTLRGGEESRDGDERYEQTAFHAVKRTESLLQK